MKKIMGLLAAMVMMVALSSYAFAHCGHCGISGGYLCSKDNVASDKAGKCSTCGGEMVKGDVQESITEVQENGKTIQKVVYTPAPAEG